MEYLSPDRVRGRSGRCTAELERMLAAKALAGKPKARQGRFSRDAVARLLSGNNPSEFDALSRVQAAQLKFEVEDKLRRFYVRPGRSLEFVFTLVHESELPTYGMKDTDAYPRLAGYCVLVRDLGEEIVGVIENVTENVQPYLEKVVSACVDAKFGAYAAPPEIRLDEVARWFCDHSPAYPEIENVVTRHSQRGWAISNPLNPSTKRLLALKVKRAANGEAVVSTTEYWYLRWWGTREGSYVYPYRETNHQLYILHREPGNRRVYQNLRPPPRSSVPSRWHQKRRRFASGAEHQERRLKKPVCREAFCSQYCYSRKSRKQGGFHMQFRNLLLADLVCVTMAVFAQAQVTLDGPFQVSYAANPGAAEVPTI